MTNGTSQGLFIVVGIVIFGIFAVMSYILFDDIFNPAIKGIYNDAREETTANIDKQHEVDFWDDLVGRNTTTSNFSKTANTAKMVSQGEKFASITIPSEVLEPKTRYKLTFDAKVLSGNMTHIGGHMHSTKHLQVKINGETVATQNFTGYETGNEILGLNKWNSGIALDGSNNYKIEVLFDTAFWDVDFPYTFPLNTAEFRSFHIDGNRHHYGSLNKAHTLEISNVKLIER